MGQCLFKLLLIYLSNIFQISSLCPGCITNGTPRWRRWPLTCLFPGKPPNCGQDIVLPLYCKIPFQIFLFLTFFVCFKLKKNWWKSCGSNVTVEDAPTPVLSLAWQRAILHPRAPSTALDQLTLCCCMVYWTHYGEYSLNKNILNINVCFFVDF